MYQRIISVRSKLHRKYLIAAALALLAFGIACGSGTSSTQPPPPPPVKTTPTIIWATPSLITYGTPLSSTQLNATASVPGTFAYSPASGTVLGAGDHQLSVVFTPNATDKYTSSNASVNLRVNPATPTISWPTPAPISYGTALGSAQLNAAASVPGTFAYTPAAGTVLTVGAHTLSVAFTPNDAVDYKTATASVSITVNCTTGCGTSGTVTWNPVVQVNGNVGGYPDGNNRQVVRTSAGVVYVVVPAQSGTANNGGTIRIYKGSPAGDPISFAEKDSAHRPSCAYRAAGDEARLGGDGIIKIAYDCSTSSNSGSGRYIEFDPATDTWGTSESVGTYTTGVPRRYESKIGMALDSNSKPHVLFGGYRESMYYSNKVSGSWSMPVQVGSADYVKPSMQFDSAGNLHVAVATPTASNGVEAIYYIQRTAAGTWTTPERIAASGFGDDVDANLDDQGPSLVFDAQGRPLVAWAGAEPGVAMRIKRRDSANSWSVVTMPTGTGLVNGHAPSLYADASGNLYALEGHQMVTDNTNCPGCEPSFNWRLESTQAWHNFVHLATAPPARDGGGTARYDVLWPGDTTHVDTLCMVENYSDLGGVCYIDIIPASALP